MPTMHKVIKTTVSQLLLESGVICWHSLWATGHSRPSRFVPTKPREYQIHRGCIFFVSPPRLCFHPCLFFAWLVGLSAGIYKNCWNNFHKTWMEEGCRPRIDHVTFFVQIWLHFLISQEIMHGSWEKKEETDNGLGFIKSKGTFGFWALVEVCALLSANLIRGYVLTLAITSYWLCQTKYVYTDKVRVYQ